MKETVTTHVSRRKAVKTIVGGVTALAAYNVLPSKWGTPIVEQMFLPAHAATSGITGNYGGLTPPGASVNSEFPVKEMLADAGNAVSNFLVSEAHADVPDSIQVPYVEVTASTIRCRFINTGAGCEDVTWPISELHQPKDGYTFTLVKLTTDKIEFKLAGSGVSTTEFTRYQQTINYSCNIED